MQIMDDLGGGIRDGPWITPSMPSAIVDARRRELADLGLDQRPDQPHVPGPGFHQHDGAPAAHAVKMQAVFTNVYEPARRRVTRLEARSRTLCRPEDDAGEEEECHCSPERNARPVPAAASHFRGSGTPPGHDPLPCCVSEFAPVTFNPAGRLVPRRCLALLVDIQGVTAKSRHGSEIPFNRCTPRSAREMPDPAMRSFTVCDTRSPPAGAAAATRAAMCTAIPPSIPAISSHSPVWIPARISSPSGRTALMTSNA